ncbi:suppressor of sable [Carabus blaptoides fortunei]
MALVCDTKSVEPDTSEVQKESENPDLEDGEIEDDDDDEEMPLSTEPTAAAQQSEQPTPVAPQILPAPIPADTNIFTQNDTPQKEKRRHSSDRKSDKHLTEAEKAVRMIHKMERAERERRDRMRREQTDDWAGNVEKAIAQALKKDRHSGVSAEEEEEEEKKRGRKRKKKDRERKKVIINHLFDSKCQSNYCRIINLQKHRKIESPKNEDIDEDEMLNVRGASPENKPHKENSPFAEAEGGYESLDSEYDSEPYHNRPNKRNFERDQRKGRNRNRETRRDRKNFREKNNRKKDNDQNRPQMQDANSICMFYMQGKCHKGDECPFSHDALPPMKLELCKFYLMDCCAKRDKCLYMHSEFPCKYYHTGLKCFAKDNCKFAHGKPLSESLKQVLLKHLETAPKEILGDFPRLSREGAQQMVNQTQKNLEVAFGIKTVAPAGPQNEKTGIPSLFDITVPMPPELMQQQPANHTNVEAESKPKSEKPESAKKVRHTRWNDEPPVQVAPLLNPAFAANMGGAFNTLTLQDQQKIQEYTNNYQIKGFYSEQDQDMRINSNGDVDMRAMPQMLPKPTETQLNFEQYKQDARLTLNMSDNNDMKMDTDIRQFSAESKLTIAEDTHSDTNRTTDVAHNASKIDHGHTSDSSVHLESSLTIDEKAGDSGSEIPNNLPKKQRELFLRIQAQQKENIPENQHGNDDASGLKDDDWYSSDDDNDPLSKMVIHLDEDDLKEEEDASNESPKRIMSPPTIKPVEVIDKLGDLSKIDISAEVTKLLTSIKSGHSSSTPASAPEIKKSRDPRQAKNLDMEITSPVLNSDPRTKPAKTERRDPRTSIYEQGIIDPQEATPKTYEDTTPSAEGTKGDVDLRNMEPTSKDLDMRPSFGDTDLRTHGGRQDVDLRQMGLPFKAMQNYTPATEIDASIASHSPIPYKVHVVDIPRPDYSGLKLNAQDAQVNADPRLRKIFRIPSSDEKDSPASPKQQTSPPKPARQDPRRRNVEKPDAPKTDISNLSYSQQLQLLQNSVFYQSLTSNQKLMLNQEIASKGEQNTPNDPILAGILSSLGLIPSLNNQNGSAMNILANVNSLVKKRVTSYFRQLSFHNEPRERKPNINENSFVTKYLMGQIKLKDGPPVLYGKSPNDLPNFELDSYSTGSDSIVGCSTGPNGGLATVKRVEKHLSVADPDIDFIDTQEEIGDQGDNSSVASRLNSEAVLPKQWSRKTDLVYGLSDSLYDMNQVTKCKNGNPIADCYGIVARGDSAILALADGVNWGEKACIAAKSAIHGCLHYLNKTIFDDTTLFDFDTSSKHENSPFYDNQNSPINTSYISPPKREKISRKQSENASENNENRISNTTEVFISILRAFNCAHNLILENQGMLTTLTVAVILPLKSSNYRRSQRRNTRVESVRRTGNVRRSSDMTQAKDSVNFPRNYSRKPPVVEDTSSVSATKVESSAESSDSSDEIKCEKYICCVCNVGDTLAYVYSQKYGIRELTKGSHDVYSNRDMRDALGALGPVDGINPELNNLTLSVTTMDAGDIVMVASDGLTDNYDPTVCKFTVNSVSHEASKPHRTSQGFQASKDKPVLRPNPTPPRDTRSPRERKSSTSSRTKESGSSKIYPPSNVSRLAKDTHLAASTSTSSKLDTSHTKNKENNPKTPDSDNLEYEICHNPLVAQFMADNGTKESIDTKVNSKPSSQRKHSIPTQKAKRVSVEDVLSENKNKSFNPLTKSSSVSGVCKSKTTTNMPEPTNVKYGFLRSKTSVDLKPPQKIIQRNEDGLPYVTPIQKYELTLLLIEDILKRGISGKEKQCSTAKVLCENLLRYTFSITAAKRHTLEDVDLYFDNKNDILVEVSPKEKKLRRKRCLERVQNLPGKLDHVSVVAYNVGNKTLELN